MEDNLPLGNSKNSNSSGNLNIRPHPHTIHNPMAKLKIQSIR